MKILGLSAFYHDSAVSIVDSGKILFAAQEERFTRKKHDESFPSHALLAGLKTCNLRLKDFEAIVFYEKPFLKMERLLETYLNLAPKGLASFAKAFPLWSQEKIFQRQNINKYLKKIDPDFTVDTGQLLFCEHHLSHGASAYYPSPFDDAVVLTMDGVGEWATTSVQKAEGKTLKLIKEIHFPHSLGLFYSAMTAFCGFRVNSGEYKLMGLAPYGEPRFRQKILDEMLISNADGSFFLEQSFFQYTSGLKMYSKKLEAFFACSARRPETEISQVYMDIAASAQAALESVVLKMLENLHKEFLSDNLCLAGGVALNCVLNEKILKQSSFKKIWVQPAAGDAGGALGAALYSWYEKAEAKREIGLTDMKAAFLGPEFSPSEIKDFIESRKLPHHHFSEEELVDKVADLLVSGQTGGWFQGRMEFGPRALGHRSILADPRDPEMQKKLNLAVKNRESFRPFAPAVLEDFAGDWFESGGDAYMLQTTQVQSHHWEKPSPDTKGFAKAQAIKAKLPAITHVDGSARIQLVHRDQNPLFYDLIHRFYEKTGVPVLINTSFNVRGEPIVCTPEDAYRCFMGTDLDWLVLGPYLLLKKDQPQSQLKKDFADQFEKD